MWCGRRDKDQRTARERRRGGAGDGEVVVAGTQEAGGAGDSAGRDMSNPQNWTQRRSMRENWHTGGVRAAEGRSAGLPWAAMDRRRVGSVDTGAVRAGAGRRRREDALPLCGRQTAPPIGGGPAGAVGGLHCRAAGRRCASGERSAGGGVHAGSGAVQPRADDRPVHAVPDSGAVRPRGRGSAACVPLSGNARTQAPGVGVQRPSSDTHCLVWQGHCLGLGRAPSSEHAARSRRQ